MEASAGPSSIDAESAAAAGISAQQQVCRWRPVEVRNDDKPPERSGAASVIYKDALYVYGGYGGQGRLDDVYRFDFKERVWEHIKATGQIPDGRENNGAVVYKDKMYLFGGYSGFSWLNDFHSFDFATEVWEPVQGGREGELPSTRFGYVSAVGVDRCFIFGGYDGTTWLNDMYEFNYIERIWQKTKVNGHPPSGRSCPSWATHDDCIYMLGGYDGVHRMNDFHQFRMASRTWFPIRSNGRAPTPRYFHACVVFGNSLYMFGGYSGSERLNDLFEYRFDIQTWFQVCAENPPGGRSSLVAHVYNSSLYIFGGYNGSVVLNDFFEFRFQPVTIPPSTMLSDLRTLMNNREYSDIAFEVGEDRQIIHANKAPLAARSEFFMNEFYPKGEKIELPAVIQYPDIKYDVFCSVLEYIYTDQVSDQNCENVVHLLSAAEMFRLERLRALCEDIVRKSISISNVVSILLMAKQNNAESLKQICMDFCTANVEILKMNGSLKDLMQEPEIMYQLLLLTAGGKNEQGGSASSTSPMGRGTSPIR